MFTGIIEEMGCITSIQSQDKNTTFEIEAAFTNELKVDQSVAHNGVCLTIEKLNALTYQVTAIHETLLKTNLGSWKVGDIVNLERCMRMNGRLDGHIVQGHVDGKAKCIDIKNQDGSWEYTFENSESLQLIVEKGSICINGVSLTAFEVGKHTFKVAIIPYTYEHTNFNKLTIGDQVNLEFDIIGKYVMRMRAFE